MAFPGFITISRLKEGSVLAKYNQGEKHTSISSLKLKQNICFLCKHCQHSSALKRCVFGKVAASMSKPRRTHSRFSEGTPTATMPGRSLCSLSATTLQTDPGLCTDEL